MAKPIERASVVRLTVGVAVQVRGENCDVGTPVLDGLTAMFGASRGLDREFAVAVAEACETKDDMAWGLLADVAKSRLDQPLTLTRYVDCLSNRIGLDDEAAVAAALRSPRVKDAILAALFVMSATRDEDEALALVRRMKLDEGRHVLLVGAFHDDPPGVRMHSRPFGVEEFVRQPLAA